MINGEYQNTELRNLFIQPLDYRISTKHKSNNYNVQNWGLGDICKDKKKSHPHRCHIAGTTFMFQPTL